jgi:hypothetical protein
MDRHEATLSTPSETLDMLRFQAVDAVLSAVSDEADDSFVRRTYYTPLQRNQIWQAYASEYSFVARGEVVTLLGPESRLAHPSIGSVPEKLGQLMLGVIGHEVACRAAIYQGRLPEQVMTDTALQDFDERSLLQRVSATWDQLPSDEHRYGLSTLGQITRETVFANAMFRLVHERNTLVETVREQHEEVTAGR